MRNTNTGTVYQSKVADGPPLLGNLMGVPFISRADDKVILAELRRRNIWSMVEPKVKIGETATFIQTSSQGTDMFIWIGDPNDGGFFWWTLVGGYPDSLAFYVLLGLAKSMMKGTLPMEVFSPEGKPCQS